MFLRAWQLFDLLVVLRSRCALSCQPALTLLRAVTFVQKLVSKKKRRFEAHGYNLDMSCTQPQAALSKKNRFFASFFFSHFFFFLCVLTGIRAVADITDQIIAMGYPSEKVEALYRNPYKGEWRGFAFNGGKKAFFSSLACSTEAARRRCVLVL